MSILLPPLLLSSQRVGRRKVPIKQSQGWITEYFSPGYLPAFEWGNAFSLLPFASSPLSQTPSIQCIPLYTRSSGPLTMIPLVGPRLPDTALQVIPSPKVLTSTEGAWVEEPSAQSQIPCSFHSVHCQILDIFKSLKF